MAETLAGRYSGHIRKKRLIGLLLLGVLAVSMILSLGTGSYPLTLGDMTAVLQGHSNEMTRHILLNIRLTRTCSGLAAGACLGMAGTIMQNVMKNPLASPFTLGVSQGAAFGAAFAIIILGAGSLHLSGSGPAVIASPWLMAAAAFTGSLVTVSLLVLLSSLRQMTPESLILSGVALSAFFGAATMLLQYFASDIQVAASVFWTFGDLGKATWREIIIIMVLMIAALFYFYANRWNYNALIWGDEAASSLGVNVTKLRFFSLVVAALISAVTIAFLGIIGFIGLMAPHLMRLLIGQDNRFLLPYAALSGAALLVISDVLARRLIAPIVLPVGILTSFAGVPLFLYLLVCKRGIGR